MWLKILVSAVLVLLFSLFFISSKNDDLIRLSTIVQNEIKDAFDYDLPKDNHHMVHTESEEHKDFGIFDFIIVGAGSAGSALAYELSAVKKWKILLLEAGDDETEFSRIPAMCVFLQKSKFNWGYYTTPQTTCCLGMENNQCVYPRGKILGGTSGINAMMYYRGNKFDYDLWEEMGNPGWSFEDVLPIFIRQETSLVLSDEGYHGNNGPLITNYTEGDSEIIPIFFKGLEELGYNRRDLNGESQYGFDKVAANINVNKRWSSNQAFVQSIKDDSKNLVIAKNSIITKVLIDEATKTAYGIEFVQNKQKYHAKTNNEVILSAGAVNSPQILMLSGIGPKEELEKHKIPVVNDLPVGKYLQDHLLFYGLNLKTNLQLPQLSMDEKLQKYLESSKPLTAAYEVEGVTFIKVETNKLDRPDIEIVFGFQGEFSPLVKFVFNIKEDVVEYIKNMDPSSTIRVYIILMHPESRGEITLRSKNPKDFPNIDVNYFSKVKDLETIYEGIKYVKKLLHTKAFKNINANIIYPKRICEKYKVDSKDYWYCIIRTITSTVYHPVGTTKMGNNTENSVVNHELKVHGIKGLRVADAGIMPEINSGHTSAPAMMIGGKAGDLIKQEYLS